jgi:hypothetical protein
MSVFSDTRSTRQAGLQTSGNGLLAAFGTLVARITARVAENRAYAELMSLDDRTLADIGLRRAGETLYSVRPESQTAKIRAL